MAILALRHPHPRRPRLRPQPHRSPRRSRPAPPAKRSQWRDPATVISKQDGKTRQWPEGVRRFTYAKQPELPAGNFPNRDNVQIGFNVLSESEKAWLPYFPGTRPDYGTEPTNDYEYALNPIAEKYGGGTEIWRMQVPGMCEKNFYPNQPKDPQDGAVKDGKLAITRDANTRYVECAIPWSELPHVKRALDSHPVMETTVCAGQLRRPLAEGERAWVRVAALCRALFCLPYFRYNGLTWPTVAFHFPPTTLHL